MLKADGSQLDLLQRMITQLKQKVAYKIRSENTLTQHYTTHLTAYRLTAYPVYSS